MEITKFYNTDYISYAMYDTYRKLANYVDGLKPSARKAIHVVRKNNITTPKKVSNLASQVSDVTEYLHGTVSMEGVITGLAQNFTGTNNINLLLPEGSFGNRNIPDAAPSRYIFTCKNPILDDVFDSNDDKLLIQQEFEDTIIEPKYFVPIIPMILVNGSEGIGNGFAQNILPRNPSNIIKALELYWAKKKIDPALFDVWFNGFTGEVRKLEDNKWEICGKIQRLNTSMFNITEIPIGLSLQQYITILNDLEEDKVIKSYTDKSEDNKFLFEIRCEREFLKQDDEQILKAMKLILPVTENFTCISESNSPIEFKTVEELFYAYINIRYEYYSKRRIYLIEKYRQQLDVLKNKWVFVNAVNEKKIVLFKQSKEVIYKQLDDKKFMRLNDSFDYLLSMRVDTFTTEKVETLKAEYDKVNELLEDATNTMCNEMWLRDLKTLTKKVRGIYD